MAGLGDGEFFDLHRDVAGLEFGQYHFGDIGGEFFDQFPAFTRAELQQALRDFKIIDRIIDGIRFGGFRDIRSHLYRQQQTLRFGAFGVRHADAIKHLEIHDGDFRRFHFSLFFIPSLPKKPCILISLSQIFPCFPLSVNRSRPTGQGQEDAAN